MKMFVFERLEQVSYNCHPEGGLMVIAENEEHVKELIMDDNNIEITSKEWEKVIVYELMDNEKPKIIVFQDAGCC